MNTSEALGILVFSCIAADKQDVAGAVERTLRAHHMFEGFRFRAGSLRLSDVSIGQPPSGGAHLKRAVLYSPKTNPYRTVIVANMQDGWQTMVNCISQDLGCRTIRVTTTDTSEEYPVNGFEVVNAGRAERAVLASKDEEGWKFVQTGRIQPFEQVRYYSRRMIRRRLDRRILEEYLRTEGWDFATDAFWTSAGEAIYVEELSR